MNCHAVKQSTWSWHALWPGWWYAFLHDMLGAGERTPLLLRGSRSESLVLNGTYESQDEESLLFLPTAADSETSNIGNSYYYTNSSSTQNKADRRGWFSRVGNALSQRLQQAQLRLSLQTKKLASEPPGRTYSTTEMATSRRPPCTFGTHREAGVWWNAQDQVGALMAGAVWLLIGYSIATVLLLAQHQQLNALSAAVYVTSGVLALASHAKTALTDPGSVPLNAVPVQQQPQEDATVLPLFTLCSICNSYKPHATHHCRICNRCISRMDHHCPWMNNCVGAGNFKHFILFLCYAWTCSVMALVQFCLYYFLCGIRSSASASSSSSLSSSCRQNQLTGLELHLVLVMTGLAVASLAFLTTMILNVQYGILTGVGTIGRLKKKSMGTWHKSAEPPTDLTDIFGHAGWHTWWLPLDPVFDEQQDRDRVFGYATSQNAVWREATHTQQASETNRRKGNLRSRELKWEIGHEPVELLQ